MLTAQIAMVSHGNEAVSSKHLCLVFRVKENRESSEVGCIKDIYKLKEDHNFSSKVIAKHI